MEGKIFHQDVLSRLIFRKLLTLFIGGFISSILKAINLPPKFTTWTETCFTEARYFISLNGSLVGYFKGERGLRQCDPLSPILFLLTMNILSKILNTAAARGFQLNVAKSDLFAAGISPRKLESLFISSGFKYGLLPVRYLGVPLITRKLTAKDCSPLVDKIISKIHQWTGKHLTYAERLELVKTVLQSTDTTVIGARVSWSNICCPKSECGLGLKDFKTWNKVYMIRNLIAGERSLWIAWIYNYVIKTKDFSQLSNSVSYSY
ncbi:uncharacterized protein LOC120126825 [Hibiscus syriacus]|uniref:uncharacterized protein LOC120126825 n=1 Tax=Hibiscus syriacus TaxID=106335 RepID=UPI0019234E4A|nr:uncharacterized protein LOC120126825 [Hibiscus syriacus]